MSPEIEVYRRQIPIVPQGAADYLLSDDEIKAISTLSDDSIKRLRESGDFPPRVQLSVRRHATWASAFHAWLAARTEKVPA